MMCSHDDDSTRTRKQSKLKAKVELSASFSLPRWGFAWLCFDRKSEPRKKRVRRERADEKRTNVSWSKGMCSIICMRGAAKARSAFKGKNAGTWGGGARG